MTLDDMKQAAEQEANTIEINWEMLENPTYRTDFEQVLQKASRFVPELESMYTTMQEGKSILFPTQDTPLKYEDLEKYNHLVEDELYQAYVLSALYTKYTLIESILQSNTDFDP